MLWLAPDLSGMCKEFVRKETPALVWVGVTGEAHQSF